MEVELDSALLGKGRDDLTLLGLCAFGLSGRHRVVRDDAAVWSQWAQGFGTSLEEDLSVAWEISDQSATIGRPVAKLRVTPTQRCLRVSDLRLPPQEAFNLLARPLRVLLENGRNDRTFLLAFADVPMRKDLDEAESKGWLEFETAGGIGELKVRLKAIAPEAQLLRTLYLCDSDAKVPGTPSPDAVVITKSLRALASRFQAAEGYFGSVLRRRAAENYAPPADVVSWAVKAHGPSHELFASAETVEGRRMLAQGTGNSGEPRRRLLASIALRELAKAAPEVVEVLDMKSGYGGGTRTEATMWQKLDDFQKAALEDGFGDSFSRDFYKDQRNLQDASGEIAAFLKILREQL